MTEAERRALLMKMDALAKEAQSLTREQARQRLAAEGFCDTKGRLSPSYGGKAAAGG